MYTNNKLFTSESCTIIHRVSDAFQLFISKSHEYKTKFQSPQKLIPSSGSRNRTDTIYIMDFYV